MKKKRTKTEIFYLSLRILIILIFFAAILEIIFTRRSDQDVSRDIYVTFQSLLLLIITFIPNFISKTWKVDIPSTIEVLFILFAASHILLGEIGRFYSRFTWWDSLLHFISGGLIALVGFSLVNLLNQHEKINVVMSPFFSAVFAICFALAVGALWEIAEFSFDSLAGGNSQRYANIYTKEDYIGQQALFDTMKDLILDLIGAIIIGVVGFFDIKLRQGKGWMDKFEIIRIESSKENK